MADIGTVKILYDTNAVLGEGPHYDEATQELLWVDYDRKKINFLDVNTGNNRFLLVAQEVTAAIPCNGGTNKQLISTIGRNVCLVNKDSGE